MGKLRPIKGLNLAPKLDAFSYQQEAFYAIRDLTYAAIFHEQGMGKTKIAVDLILYWLEKGLVDTVVVVAKKSLVLNWRRELFYHTHIVPQILNQSRMNNFNVFNSPSRVVLTHFEVFLSERERFSLYLKSRDVGVVIDESAKIKNPNARLTQAIIDLAPLFKKRVIMTGTPVANRPEDIWSQIYFLDGGKSLGGIFTKFKKQVSLNNRLAYNEEKRIEFELNVSGIFKQISHFSVRETKNGSCLELPEKVYSEVITTWETIQYDLYKDYQTDLRGFVVRDGLPIEDRVDNILKRLLRLVQIASNPRLIHDEYSRNPGKLPYLIDLVQQIVDNKEKCIVWSYFNENVDWLAKQLIEYGVRKLHGRMNMDQRNRSVEKFLTNDDIRVLVATPGVAKEGLTLTAANHSIFFDRSFSLDDYLQAQDRIHRISQNRTCYIYNLVMEDSIDQWVDVLLEAKHMAAMLAQGDIDLLAYQAGMDYSFGDILNNILEIPENHEAK